MVGMSLKLHCELCVSVFCVAFTGLSGCHGDRAVVVKPSPDHFESGKTKAPGGKKEMKFKLASKAFAANGKIPRTFTGEGDDVSPPLAWDGTPTVRQNLH